MMNSFALQTGNRFADYFVICGLDLNSGLESDRFYGDNLQSTPLDRSYKSKVLGHYPETVPWNPFDKNAVCMLCLPNGLHFRTQKHSLEPTFHSFVITREDGSRSYGFSYIFYEEVQNKKISSAMQTLQAMHLTELSSYQRGCISKHGRLSDDTHNTRSLPRHFKLSTYHQGAAQSYYDVVKDSLYVSKSIALISQLPYVFAAKTFLEGLYKCSLSPPENRYNLESYVFNLLYEVPIPQPGRSIQFTCFCGGAQQYERVVIQRPSSIEELPVFDFPLREMFCLLGIECVIQLFTCVLLENQILLCSSAYERVVIQRPSSIEELPVFDFPLREMFCLLGIECVIQLFTCVLLENQILLCSSDYQRLMVVAESITCLLFPFMWQHVYVPILPASLQHFLDAPVPFVMGLHSCESNVKLANEGDLCYVDIDNQRIQLPEELPSFPQQQELISELRAWFKTSNIPIERFDRKLSQTSITSTRNSNSSNLMTRSYHFSSSSQFRRKHSWSHDSDSGVSDTSFNGTHSPISGPSHSEAFQKQLDIVRRAGVSLHDIDGNLNLDHERELTNKEQYIEDLMFNIAVREIFLNRFVHIFSAYEHFIIQPNQDREQWLNNRDSMQNFDKATFLSDQPDQHLPFLSRFIESQMFASLIDNKIMTTWSEVDPNLRVFDRRIYLLRSKFGEGLVRTPSYEECSTIRDSQLLLEKRLTNINIFVPIPHEIRLGAHVEAHYQVGIFPLLDSVALKEPHRASKHSNIQRHYRKENKYSVEKYHRKNSGTSDLTQELNYQLQSDSSANGIGCISTLSSFRQPKLSTEVSPAFMAQTNWEFVEKFLEDCKVKTKRMLLEKMGTEAIELGHKEGVSITGVEENTLIASLCDLLEKIWSHGLLQKQGKSGLWSHLANYQELQECNDTSKPIGPNFLTPDLSSMALETDVVTSSPGGQEARRSYDKKSPSERKSVGMIEQPVLHPLPVSLSFDMRNVQAMTDIKTHIGYARAWIRLSLEKKLLSRHLRTLLSDVCLLTTLYKRSAFLRCEEEKEQFLYYLLTLNAVDYFCFTNTYTTTKIPYRVLIFPSRKSSATATSANTWVQVSGTLDESSCVPIPRGSLDFVFQHKNLGILTTLRIGHDNNGPSPKWLVEHVIVRNEVTGHTYKFPCGRWLGKGIDDGSTERLLVGELVPRHVDNEELIESCRTPPRCRSPSVPRKLSVSRLSEIERMLGDSVNKIFKFYCGGKYEKDRSTLTLLLCGEMGLVYCLEQVFLYGFKSSRLFGKNLYLWDYFVRVREQYEINQFEDIHSQSEGDCSSSFYIGEQKCNKEAQAVMQHYCHLLDQINGSSHTLGKDGKFQLFVCLCARDHLLHRMIPCLASSKVTVEMYEEQSYLRDPSLVTFLKQILGSLDEFDIVLENSLTKGIGP